MFVENPYLTESLFILLMKSCTTRTKGNDLNPSNLVKLSRRLEPQPWIYDVPLSSLLYGDTKYQRQYHHMETSRETTRVYHDAIKRWISPQKPASNQQLIHMLVYLGLIPPMGQHSATITGKAYIFAIKLYPSNANRSNYDTVPASLGTIFTPAITRNWAIETLCRFSQSRTGTRVGNIRML